MSVIRDALIAKLQEKITLSKEYADVIDSAKTNVKKDIYLKKLRKNNKAVADMLVSLDKIEKAREEKNAKLSNTEG